MSDLAPPPKKKLHLLVIMHGYQHDIFILKIGSYKLFLKKIFSQVGKWGFEPLNCHLQKKHVFDVCHRLSPYICTSTAPQFCSHCRAMSWELYCYTYTALYYNVTPLQNILTIRLPKTQ